MKAINIFPLIVSLFVCSSALQAQSIFAEAIYFAGQTKGPSSVYSCDIDGDGDQDVLSASIYDDKIAWFENINGSGVFGTQKIISTDAKSATCVYACDMDNDGDMDVISSSALDNKIAWYENSDGLGNFGPQQIISTSVGMPFSVYACDIDGDGDQDVLSASLTDSKIAWYENLGNGSFGQQNVISANAASAYCVYASDIDGDGDQDVLYSGSGVFWLENTDGNGNFSLPMPISNSTSFATSVYACDIDGDGDNDALSTFSNSNRIAWYENTDGLGAFGPQLLITTSVDEANDVYACDLDGDGDIDVISASGLDNKIAWYENTNGNGTFGPQNIISNTEANAMSVYAGDYDGDGDMDILSAAQDYGVVAWHENSDGLGNFGLLHSVSASGNAIGLFACDIDGDGDQDVLSTLGGFSSIDWYENFDGSGTFYSQHKIDTMVNMAISVCAGDLDGDGDQDVISASYYDDKIAWYENIDGNGTFGLKQIISTSADAPNSVLAFDIDGDGDQDVLSASEADDKVAWYKNLDGLGTFSTEIIITTTADYASSIWACDLDGDGDMDVLSTSGYDDKVAWYENMDGNGLFGQPIIITTSADGAIDVFACDLDGDGDQDVLTASSNDDKIAWFENLNGTGSFGPEHILTINLNQASSVCAFDIDGDGDNDIIASSYWNILLFENTGGSSLFGTPDTLNIEGLGAISIYPKDLDGDGDIDLLSVPSHGGIAWQENLTIQSVPNIVKNGVIVYPNPTNETLIVNNGNTPIHQLRIFDITGKLILEKSNLLATKTIDVSAFVRGIYILSIQTENGIYTSKFVKE